jgi:predicted transglutaminase-like cysteine proteinase
LHHWKHSTIFCVTLVSIVCCFFLATQCLQASAQSETNKSRPSVSTKGASLSQGKKKSAFRMLFKPPPVKKTTPKPQKKVIASTGPLKDKRGNIRLFRTMELKGKNKTLARWQRIVNKMAAHKQQYLSNSLPTSGKNQRQRWKQFKSTIVSASRMQQLRKVNTYFNKWPYRLDEENWGQREYWASPPEFVKKSGDCEDYAIAKYYALRELGVPASSMRIVALMDNIRRLGHAVLVVFHEGDAWVLDNQTKLVLSHSKFSHYVPQFSVNETNRWAHIPVKKINRLPSRKNDLGAENAY